jgi:hypothetical protein
MKRESEKEKNENTIKAVNYSATVHCHGACTAEYLYPVGSSCITRNPVRNGKYSGPFGSRYNQPLLQAYLLLISEFNFERDMLQCSHQDWPYDNLSAEELDVNVEEPSVWRLCSVATCRTTYCGNTQPV